jgi:hypothetical protein
LFAASPRECFPSMRAPIHLACETSFRTGSNAFLVDLLLTAEADPNQPVGQGPGAKRPLLLAAASGLTKVCEALYKKKPWRLDVNVVDQYGRGAHQLANNASRNDTAPVLLSTLHCPMTHAVRPPPERVTEPNMSRQLRRSMTTCPRRAQPLEQQLRIQVKVDNQRLAFLRAHADGQPADESASWSRDHELDGRRTRGASGHTALTRPRVPTRLT